MRFFNTIILITLFASLALAHSDKEIEDELMSIYKDIETNSSYQPGYSEDRDRKLADANKKFQKRLLEVTAQHASTLKYRFPDLREKVSIKTASDNGLRIYSWDTHQGGTMHFYGVVYQFAGVEGVYSQSSFWDEGDPAGSILDVSSIKTRTGTVYLATFMAILSTSYRGQTMHAYQVDGNTLSEGVKIFRTKSGPVSSLGFSYDFFSVVNNPSPREELFNFNPRTREISFPVVIESEEVPQGKVTKRRIVYKFDGEFFRRIRN